LSSVILNPREGISSPESRHSRRVKPSDIRSVDGRETAGGEEQKRDLKVIVYPSFLEAPGTRMQRSYFRRIGEVGARAVDLGRCFSLRSWTTVMSWAAERPSHGQSGQ